MAIANKRFAFLNYFRIHIPTIKLQILVYSQICVENYRAKQPKGAHR